MKKLFTLLSILATTTAFSQEYHADYEFEGMDMLRYNQGQPYYAPGQGDKVTDEFFLQKGNPSDTCGTDTIEYPLVGKATALQLWQIDGTGYLGFGQYYDAPQDIVIEGVKFYGHVQDNAANSDTVFAWIKLYDASPVDSMPTTPLDSVEVAMVKAWNNNNIEDGAYVAMFNSPVTVSSAYFLSLEHSGADTVVTLSNSVTNSDGAGENLGFYNYANVWYRNIDFISFDADWILHPIVRYEFRADFSIMPDSICLPSQGGFDTVCTTNMVSAAHGNRMYNSQANPNWYWDWGNGLQGIGFEPCATYDSPGSYTISQTDTIYGWNTTCVSTQTQMLHVQQSPFSTYTINSTGDPFTFDFTNTSTNGTSYYWTFGDGDNSTLQDPSHTYAASGNYEVWLFVYNECGVDSSSQGVFITVGVEEESLENQIQLYPNPSTGQFWVGNLGNESLQVEVFNAIGEKVAEHRLGNELVIDLNEHSNGMYYVRFTSDNAVLTKQVQLLR